MKLLNPRKTKLAPDTIGSKYMAWSPVLGLHDIRWASELPPFGKMTLPSIVYDDQDMDKDMDEYEI